MTFLSSLKVTYEFRISTFISYNGLSNSCLLGTCTPMYSRVHLYTRAICQLKFSSLVPTSRQGRIASSLLNGWRGLDCALLCCWVLRRRLAGALKKREEGLDYVSCFSNTSLVLWPLPGCFEAEWSAVEASLFVQWGGCCLVLSWAWSGRGKFEFPRVINVMNTFFEKFTWQITRVYKGPLYFDGCHELNHVEC